MDKNALPPGLSFDPPEQDDLPEGLSFDPPAPTKTVEPSSPVDFGRGYDTLFDVFGKTLGAQEFSQPAAPPLPQLDIPLPSKKPIAGMERIVPPAPQPATAPVKAPPPPAGFEPVDDLPSPSSEPPQQSTLDWLSDGAKWMARGLFDPQEYVETAKGIPGGAVGIVGTGVKGAAVLDSEEAFKRSIMKYSDDVRRIPDMSDEEVAAFKSKISKEPLGKWSVLSDALRNIRSGETTPDEWVKKFSPTNIQDFTVYKTGEEISKFGRDISPAAKGYEESGGRMLGEGLGSLLGAIPISVLGGPVAGGAFFMSAGSGEAIERAVQYDKKEREAGRPGLTQDQIHLAGVLGSAPGATDSLALEALLGRIKLPVIKNFKKPLAKAIARIGGQAFIEGFQEGGQQFLQNLIAQEVYNPDQELGEGIIPNTAVGGGVGGIAGVGKELLTAFSGRKHRGGGTPPPQPSPAPNEPPASEPSAAAEEQAATPQQPVPPSSPTSPSPQDDIAILLGAGNSLSDIAAMSPEEIAQEVEDARSAGAPAYAPDTPVAEPSKDLLAQARDLRDPENDRLGVWLSANARAQLETNPQAAIEVYRSGVPIENFDGKGGTLIAQDEETAQEAQQLIDEGVDLQTVLGALTRAGEGKPADASKVVQQIDTDGAVTRESAVTEDQVASTEKEFQAPGRTVETVDPQEAITRREDEIAAEEFDPFSIPLVPTYKRQGAEALRNELNSVNDAAQLRALAKSQQIVLPRDLRRGEVADVEAIRTAIVDAVAARVDDRAAGSKPAADAVPGTEQSPIDVKTAEDVAEAGAQVDPDPTPQQIKKDDYDKGHIRFQDIDIALETPKGGTRKSDKTDSDGKPLWEVQNMPAAYGYVKSVKGKDGDELDVFVGDNPKSDRVFVIDQVDAETGKFDEHKVVLGTNSLDEAGNLYSRSYSDGKGPDRIGGIKEMTMAEFKAWMNEEPGKAKKEPAARDVYDGEPLSNDEIDHAVMNWKYVQDINRTKPPESLTSFIVARGGLKNQQGDVGHLSNFGKDRPGLINNRSGMNLDDAARLAWEEGFFSLRDVDPGTRPTISDFLDALSDDIFDGTVVRQIDSEYFEHRNIADELAEELAEYGVTTNKFRTEASLRRYFGQTGTRKSEEDARDQEAEAAASERPGGAVSSERIDDVPFDTEPARIEEEAAPETGPSDSEATVEAVDKREAAKARRELAQLGKKLIGKPQSEWAKNADKMRELADKVERAYGETELVKSTRASLAEIDKLAAALDEAARIGKEAFSSGQTRAPATSKAVLDLIEKNDGHAVAIMDAFTKAWDKANLAAPVDGTTKGKVINEYGHYLGQRVSVRDNFGRSKYFGSVTGKLPSGALTVRKDGYTGGDMIVDNPLFVVDETADKPAITTEKSGQTSLAPPPTVKEEIAAAEKQKSDKGKSSAQPMDEGLFGDAGRQGDLVDQVKAAEKADAKKPNFSFVPKDGWWNDLIKSREFANALAIPHQGLKVEEIVAKITKALEAEEKRQAAEERAEKSPRESGEVPQPETRAEFIDALMRGSEGAERGPEAKGPDGSVYRIDFVSKLNTYTFVAKSSEFSDFATRKGPTGPRGSEASIWTREEAARRASDDAGFEKAPQKPVDAAEQPETQSPREAKRAAPVQASEEIEVVPSDTITLLRDRLISEGFKNIREARKFLEEIGLDGTNKAMEETIEKAVVMAAREIAQSGKPSEVYAKLVDLYNNQPNLATRTSTSTANQAYSTPVPLAYVASRLADVSNAEVVYEPSAGNGALLIEAEGVTIANEINPDRAAQLRDILPSAEVTEFDATDPAQAQKIRDDHGGAEAVIMNPPFGAVKEGGKSVSWEADGLNTTQIDHAIALQSLKAMTDEGKAVLILGGVNAESIAERRKGYRGQAKRLFYKKIYDNYNVVDHFTVSGDLYKKQGAGWPVDVVVIDGRGKSARPLPAAEPPALLKSWDEIGAKLDGDTAAKVERPARKASERVGQPDRGNEPDRVDDAGSRVEPSARSDKPSTGEVRKSDTGRQPGNEGGKPSERDRVQAGTDGKPGTANEPAAASNASPRVKPKIETKGGQTTYAPSSSGNTLNTLVPQNMATATGNALKSLEERQKSPDVFVTEKLGYDSITQMQKHFAAEQVDALALAIDNVERGSAFIIGDQTGIGKGRVVAGMLRYALRQGWQPVFVTEKPNLYGDMFRDMNDIGLPEMLGRDVRAYMTNVGEVVPLDKEAKGWVEDKSAADVAWEEHKAAMEEKGTPLPKNAKRPKEFLAPKRRGKFLTSGGKARSTADREAIEEAIAAGSKSPFDIVFTTYDQNQAKKGVAPERRDFIERILPQSMLVLDETHNAAGSQKSKRKSKEEEEGAPDRAAFFRQAVQRARGVMYSSATYAKRPEVMDLYSRTGMGDAIDDASKLPALIQRGGVPMQQILASMLSESGQYVRRERSFEGVGYNIDVVNIDEQSYRSFALSVRAIFRFDKVFEPLRKEFIQAELDKIGAVVTKDSGVGEASAHSTAFGSIMHNVVDQMLLSIKADAAADEAISAHKEGKRPVLALASTMEKFITDFASANDTEIGQNLDADFGDVLQRYLERTLRYTVKIPDSNGNERKEHRYIPYESIPADLRQMYDEAQSLIRDADFGGMPVSPIDWIRHRLTEAGLSVSEITGRDTRVDYSKNAKYVKRSRAEKGSIGKSRSIDGFNSGKIDALILNQAGATGLSIHASKDFKDQKQRHMIIVQAEKNVDTHLQMLGRIHRSGQVVLPSYSQFTANIPAEARPAAVLAKKMASLNASTTGSRGSVFLEEATDFVNEVGDYIVADIVMQDPELELNLGLPLKIKNPETGTRSSEDAARRVTGKMTLLLPEEQRDLIDTIKEAYAAEIKRLDDMGENPLEAKTLDLQAEVIEEREIKPRRGPGAFLDATTLTAMSVKAMGKAMTPEEIVTAVADSVGKKAQGEPSEAIAMLAQQGATAWEKKRAGFIDKANAWIETDVVQRKDESQASTRARHEANLERWQEATDLLTPGARIQMQMKDSTQHGVVLSVERRGKTKNPLALSSWYVNIAVPDPARTVFLPLSQVYTPGYPKEDGGPGVEMKPSPVPYSGIFKQHEESRASGRETIHMMTGNILAGYEQFPGQIVNFTMKDGSLRPGIFLGRKFDADEFMDKRAIRLYSGEQIAKFLDQVPRAEILSTDGVVKLVRRYGDWIIETPSSRQKGGVYFTDRAVRNALGSDEFVKRGGDMIAETNRDRFVAAVDALRSAGALFETREHQDIATEIVGQEAKPLAALGNARNDERASITKRLNAGETVSVPMDVVDRILEEVRPLARIIRPPGTDVMVMTSAKPIRGTVDAEVTFKSSFGGTVVATIEMRRLADTRSVYFGGGINAIGIVRFSEDVGPSAAAEVWHEAIHAWWSRLGPGIKSRLGAHANSIGVMQMPLREFLHTVGDPQYWRISEDVTVEQAYRKLYRGASDLQDRLDQEAVAHMAELGAVGALTQEEFQTFRRLAGQFTKGMDKPLAALAGPIERTVRLYRGEPADASGGLGHHYTRSLARAKGFAGPGGEVYYVDIPIEAMGGLKRSRDPQNFVVPKEFRDNRKKFEGVTGQAATADARLRDRATRNLEAGLSVQIDSDVVETLQATLRDQAGAIPTGTTGHAVKRFRRVSEKYYAPEIGRETFDVEIDLVDASGKLETVTADWYSVSTARAFFVPPWNKILLIRFATFDGIERTLAGELRHEAAHARQYSAGLDRNLWRRLVDHARNLRLLDTEIGTYFNIVGQPVSDKVANDTLLSMYVGRYSWRNDFEAAMDGEFVAHMVELHHHGGLLPQEIEPVLEDLLAFMGGDVEGGVATKEAAAVAALANGDNISLDEKIANFGAVRDFIEAMPETRRVKLNDSVDVVVEPSNAYVHYSVVESGKPKWAANGDSNALGEFIVKASQRMSVRGVEVTNARLNTDLRRQGIGSFVYDLVDKDFAPVGGLSPSPRDQLSPDAIAFWENRLGDGVLFAITGQDQRREFDQLGYYSKALEAAKALKQDRGTPEQMLAQLKKAGVKDAEIEATGLNKFFDRASAHEVGDDFWRSQEELDRNLSGDQKAAIDSWVGGDVDTQAKGLTGGLMIPAPLESMSDSALHAMGAPVRELLRRQYGDYITVYRGQRVGGTQSTGRQNKLASYSTSRETAEWFAGARNDVVSVSESEIARAQAELDATGTTTVGKYRFERNLEDSKYIDGYRNDQFVTDTLSIRDWFSSDIERANEVNIANKSARDSVKEIRLPIDAVVWATDRFNQNEIIAFAGREDGKPSVTKAEIVRHLRQNRVGLNEAIYSKEIISEADALKSERIDILSQPRDRQDFARLAEIESRLSDLTDDNGRIEGTRYASYSLDPNNPTYRETVLHLPSNARSPIELAELVAREMGSSSVEDAAKSAGMSVDEFIKEASSSAIQREADSSPNFNSGHFSEPNIIGHMMTSMVKHEGKPTFLIDQIQSDWGQRLRDGGVRDEAKIAELKERLAEKYAEHNPKLQEWDTFRDSLGEKANARGGSSKWLPRSTSGDISALLSGAQNWYDDNSFLLSDAQKREFRDNIMQIEYARRDLQLPEAELRTAEAATSGNPLVNTTDQWVNTTLRRAITQAVAADAEYIAIPSGDTVLDYNPGDAAGMAGFYGWTIPNNALAEEYSKQAEVLEYDISQEPPGEGREELVKELKDVRRFAEAARNGIEGIVPKNLRKILSKMDKEAARSVRVDKVETPTKGMKGRGFTLFPITKAVKEAVKSEGLPMFSFGGMRAQTATSKLRDYLQSAFRSIVYGNEPSTAAIPSDADLVPGRIPEFGYGTTAGRMSEANIEYRADSLRGRVAGNRPGDVLLDGTRALAPNDLEPISDYERAVFDRQLARHRPDLDIIDGGQSAASLTEPFFKSGFTVNSGASLTLDAAYDHYLSWAEQSGLPILSKLAFDNAMRMAGYSRAKIAGRVRYIGVQPVALDGRVQPQPPAIENADVRTELKEDIDSALEIVGRIAGKDVKVEFPPVIVPQGVTEGQRRGTEAIAGSVPATASGVYKPGTVNGEALIRVAMANPADALHDIRTVAGHEAWHHVETALATDREVSLLNSPAEMKRIRGWAAAELGTDPGNSALDAMPAWELRAIAFQRFRRMREEGMETASGLHIATRRLWDRLVRLFRAVANAVRGRGFDSADAIFERARTGEMARRDSSRGGYGDSMFSIANNDITPSTPGLDMSEEARMARARQMGFDTTFVAYRGIRHDYDPEYAMDRDWQMFARDRDVAEPYGKNVIEAYLRLGKNLAVDAAGANWDRIPLGSIEFSTIQELKLGGPIVTVGEIARAAKRAGYDSITVTDVMDDATGLPVKRTTVDVVFEPSNIRSVDAAFDPANAESANLMYALAPRAMPRLPSSGLLRRMSRQYLDPFRVAIQDKALPISRVAVERIEEQQGIALPDNLNTYLAEGLYTGRAGERLVDLKEKALDPLIEHLRDSEISFEEMGDYLYARHAEERNLQIGQMYEAGHDFFEAMTNPDIVGGSGMSTTEANQILADVRASGKQAAYDEAARMTDQMISDARTTLLRSGLIDRETYDDWSTRYSNYVPLRGFDVGRDDNPERPRTGRGFDTRGKEAMQALGRRSKSDNPLLYVVQQAEQAIIRAEKNRVGKTLKRAVEAHPDPSIWNIYRGQYKRRVNPSTGLVEFYWAPPPWSNPENVYGVKVGGKQHWIEIKHAGLARAVRGVGADMNIGYLAPVMWLTRNYAKLLTAYNPEFVLSNLVRDIETAMLNVTDVKNKPKDVRLQMAKNVAKSMRGAYRALRGDTSTEWAQWFEEYRLAGGKISFMEFNDVERIQRRINSAMKEGRTMRAVKSFFRYVEDVNTAVENGTRLALYRALRENGVSQDRAAFAARELTVNFNRRGELSPIINSLYIFFNASVQGTTRMMQAIGRSKALRYAVGGIAMTGFMMEMLNAFLLSGDDDDGEKSYDKIKDWILDRNIVIMMPGSDKNVMIPMAYGWSIPYVIGQKMGAMARGKTSPADAAASILNTIVENFNPVGGSVDAPLMQTLSPTILDPYVQVETNKTWYGGPIYPTKYDKRKPESQNYFDSAPDWAVETSRILNEMTGGNRARSGYIDVSPEVLEHYLEFIGGGVGKFANRLYATGERIAHGEEWLPEKTPILRRFYSKTTATAKKREFYEAWDDVDSANYEVKQLKKLGDIERAQEARKTYQDQLSVYPAMKSTYAKLKKLREQRSAIENSTTLSNTKRREMLEVLRRRETQIINSALSAYNKAVNK